MHNTSKLMSSSLPEIMVAYLTEALESGDDEFIAQAIGTVARALGITEVAKAAGLTTRERISHVQCSAILSSACDAVLACRWCSPRAARKSLKDDARALD